MIGFSCVVVWLVWVWWLYFCVIFGLVLVWILRLGFWWFFGLFWLVFCLVSGGVLGCWCGSCCRVGVCCCLWGVWLVCCWGYLVFVLVLLVVVCVWFCFWWMFVGFCVGWWVFFWIDFCSGGLVVCVFVLFIFGFVILLIFLFFCFFCVGILVKELEWGLDFSVESRFVELYGIWCLGLGCWFVVLVWVCCVLLFLCNWGCLVVVVGCGYWWRFCVGWCWLDCVVWCLFCGWRIGGWMDRWLWGVVWFLVFVVWRYSGVLGCRFCLCLVVGSCSGWFLGCGIVNWVVGICVCVVWCGVGFLYWVSLGFGLWWSGVDFWLIVFVWRWCDLFGGLLVGVSCLVCGWLVWRWGCSVFWMLVCCWSWLCW